VAEEKRTGYRQGDAPAHVPSQDYRLRVTWARSFSTYKAYLDGFAFDRVAQCGAAENCYRGDLQEIILRCTCAGASPWRYPVRFSSATELFLAQFHSPRRGGLCERRFETLEVFPWLLPSRLASGYSNAL